MPTMRLSTGRTVARMPPAKIAAVKELRFQAPAIVPFPRRAEMTLQGSGEPLALAVQLDRGVVIDLPAGELAAPAVQAPPAALAHVPIEAEPLEVLSAATEGKPFERLDVGPLPAPPPLRRAYQVELRDGEPEAAETLDAFDLLRPLLEPPAAPGDAAGETPAGLRAYQAEAVRALLAQDALLLADDLGTGKTVAACQAMLALFQQGQARRSLVLGLDHQLRHWDGHLAAWAPGLSVTCVRGEAEQRALDWQTPAHVFLTDYETLVHDLEHGLLPAEAAFDLVVLDSALAGRGFDLLRDRLKPRRRWALADGLPAEAGVWRQLFGFLTPDQILGSAQADAAELSKRLAPAIFRRTKLDVANQMPELLRQEVWLDLDAAQQRAYGEVLADERHRLGAMGAAVSRSQLAQSVERLKQVCNQGTSDGPGVKQRALAALIQTVADTGSKVVVQTRSRQDLERLQRPLAEFGVVMLHADQTVKERTDTLESFRNAQRLRVLLTAPDAVTETAPMPQASYAVHVDPSWNAGARLRLERQLFPKDTPRLPVTVYEFWVAGTIDERVHRLLAERGLLASDLTPETPAYQVEERVLIDDWLQRVLEIGPGPLVRRSAAARPAGTGVLPSTDLLRNQLTALSPAELMDGVARWMQELGFPQTESLTTPSEQGGDLLAWRLLPEEGPGGKGVTERVFVRFLRTAKNVGVGEAKALLSLLDKRHDCLGGYLVATTEFTSACRKLADDSSGRLALVTGAELWRHLHIQGLV